LSIGAVETQRDATLVGVRCEPGKTAFGVRCIAVERPEAAIGIAARRLDLDYIRTEVGQELAAGPTNGLGQIQHAIGFKRLERWRFHKAHYNT
jgi:hypothetical protein